MVEQINRDIPRNLILHFLRQRYDHWQLRLDSLQKAYRFWQSIFNWKPFRSVAKMTFIRNFFLYFRYIKGCNNHSY